jgi:hypothetical protein
MAETRTEAYPLAYELDPSCSLLLCSARFGDHLHFSFPSEPTSSLDLRIEDASGLSIGASFRIYGAADELLASGTFCGTREGVAAPPGAAHLWVTVGPGPLSHADPCNRLSCGLPCDVLHEACRLVATANGRYDVCGWASGTAGTVTVAFR